MLKHERFVVAVVLLAACGKPLRFFGDGGLPEAAIDDTGTPLPDGPDIDADLTDARICTTLAPPAGVFTANIFTGTPPITGGVLEDATYKLRKVEQTSGINVYREGLRLTGAGTGTATFEQITLSTNSTGTWSTAGTNLTMTPTCGPGAPTTRGYSYDPATGVLVIVDFFDPNDHSQERVFTYQRQP